MNYPRAPWGEELRDLGEPGKLLLTGVPDVPAVRLDCGAVVCIWPEGISVVAPDSWWAQAFLPDHSCSSYTVEIRPATWHSPAEYGCQICDGGMTPDEASRSYAW